MAARFPPTGGGNVRRTKGARIIHRAILKLITIHHQTIPLVSQHSGKQAAQAILQFTAGKTFHEYATDWVLRSAVERQITKIGGAAARLIVNIDPNAQRIGSSAGTLGFGNKQDHSWPDFEPHEIWEFIQKTLPSLLNDTTAILEDEPVDQPGREKSQRRKIIPLVARRKPQIRNLCRRYHVKRLDVFGSAAVGEFDPDTSDIDFLVEFDESDDISLFETRRDLTQALESLFNRSVDLVIFANVENPYFRSSVENTREPIFEA